MDIADEIAKALSEYSEEVAENLEAIKKEVAKDTVEMLKSTSPRGRRGKYAKGWRMKKDGTGYYVYNATDYRLTHLLERGHAKAYNLTLELYSEEKDLELEQKLEALLDANNIEYDTFESYLDTESMYEVAYDITI